MAGVPGLVDPEIRLVNLSTRRRRVRWRLRAQAVLPPSFEAEVALADDRSADVPPGEHIAARFSWVTRAGASTFNLLDFGEPGAFVAITVDAGDTAVLHDSVVYAVIGPQGDLRVFLRVEPRRARCYC